MANPFGGGGGQAAPVVVQAPTVADPAVEEARQKEILAAQKQRGRAASLITGGEGLTSVASTEKTTLLGRG